MGWQEATSKLKVPRRQQRRVYEDTGVTGIRREITSHRQRRTTAEAGNERDTEICVQSRSERDFEETMRYILRVRQGS